MQTGLDLVELFTDGACSGNPGPGGWGAILRCRGKEKELSGGEKETTNNRMELTAVIEGLRALKKRCHIKSTQIHNMLPMQSPKDGPLAGGATAGGKQIRNPRSTRSCGRSC